MKRPTKRYPAIVVLIVIALACVAAMAAQYARMRAHQVPPNVSTRPGELDR
jgi:hypothetical protein